MAGSIFKVEKKTRTFVFMSANVMNIPALSDELSDYFFNETDLFRYFKCTEQNISFDATSNVDYAALYRDLSYFIETRNKTKSQDKAGKIGEYFLSILLLKHFKFKCIIPKLIHITDRNMPIYGIDTLFYSQASDLLMFGESKFTGNLDTAITLLNTSISNYDKQFDDELTFIVNNKGFSCSNNRFLKEFAVAAEKAIDFKHFIRLSGIKRIGIPLFICHGTEINSSIIINTLEAKLKKREVILGMNVIYIVISLPINDKEQFLSALQQGLKKKQIEYERKSR